jgi:hypothetical protein
MCLVEVVFKRFPFCLRPVDGAVLPPLHKRSDLMFALLELAWKSLVSFAGELFALSCFDGTAEEVGGNRNIRITRCHLKSQHDATWTANTQMKKLVAVQHCEEHCEKTPGGSLQVLLKKHVKDRGSCNQRAQRLGFTRADKFITSTKLAGTKIDIDGKRKQQCK